jgi:hypothetical protein
MNDGSSDYPQFLQKHAGTLPRLLSASVHIPDNSPYTEQAGSSLTCIREVSSSNIGRDSAHHEVYFGLPQSF